MWLWTSILTLSAVALTPTPKELSVDEDDRFLLRGDMAAVVSDPLMVDPSLFDPLSYLGDGAPRIARASELDKVIRALYIATVDAPGAFEKRKLRRYFPDDDAPLPAEGFQITVNKQGIFLVGADARGVWYGLNALSGLVEEYGTNLPYLKLRDWPALRFRGVYLYEMPTSHTLRNLAALRATHVFIDNDDFYDLRGVRADAWGSAFEAIRAHRMEPIPVFSTLAGMEKTLRDHPTLIEGRSVAEAITLNGVQAKALRHPNIIALDGEDIVVRISGVPCVEGADYWLEGPPIQAPFHENGPRWQIWRELEGAIPDGGTVTVEYSYATADSASLCFAEPTAWRWLEEQFAQIVSVLKPTYIHLDHGEIGRLNTDLRSRIAGLSHGDRFVESLSLLNTLLEGADERVQPMIWADLINPFQDAPTYGLGEVGAAIPARIQPLGRVHLQTTKEARERYARLARITQPSPIIGVDGSVATIHVLVGLMEAQNAKSGGIIALADGQDSLATTLSTAWTGSNQGSLWLRGLNDFFGADLVDPDYLEIRAALVAALNQWTLSGRTPEDFHRTYRDYANAHWTMMETDEAAAALVSEMLAQLTDYLVLESEFSRDGNDGTLRKLQRLVESIQKLDPDPEEDRYQRILDTIETQQLFVPASILLQSDLRYFRPGETEHPLVEIPLRPTYADRQGQVGATIELLHGHAPIRRIDFEGLGIGEVRLDLALGRGDLQKYQQWDLTEGLQEIRGPIRVKHPAPAHAMRVTALGDRGPLVLRDIRLFAEKAPPIMEAHYAVQAPAMVPQFEGRAWAKSPQGHGFLQRDTTAMFAEAPTAVWVTHTRDALYFGVEAGETRPDAIVADLQARDAPLWEQESVELWIQRDDQLPLRLVVNPLGTIYDSEANDPGWDGPWTVVAARNDHGWSAVIRVPMELVGSVKRGDVLPVNVVRNRMGVIKEESAWAHRYGAQPELQWGALRFP